MYIYIYIYTYMKETWDLHRRAMVWGMLATMSILFQRPFQLVFIVLRKAQGHGNHVGRNHLIIVYYIII